MSDYDSWKLESREDEQARISRESGYDEAYGDDEPKAGDPDYCPHGKWHPMDCMTCAPASWAWHQQYYGYPDSDRAKYWAGAWWQAQQEVG